MHKWVRPLFEVVSMPSTMKAAVVRTDELCIEEVDVPHPKPYEVLVRV